MIKSFSLLNKRFCINYAQIKYIASFLYVTGDRAREVYSSVQPHVDFDDRVNNIAELDKNVKKRQIDIDVFELQKLWDFYKIRLDFKQKLEANKTEIRSNIDKLLSNKNYQNKNEIEGLKLKFELVKDDLKNVTKTLWDIENNVVIKTLSLPNDLHARVPDEEVVIDSFKEPSDFGRDHLEAGEKFSCLDYFNNSSYYLKNNLALFEIVTSQYFVDQFTFHKFIPFSNPDFSRSVLIEGCTLKTEAPDIALMLNDREKNQKHKVYLNGGASFLPFFGFHAKHFVELTDLPLRYVTQGRQYNPKAINNLNGLYSAWQSTAVEIFIGTSCSCDLSLEFDDAVEKVKNIYKSFDMHFKVVYIPSNQLKPWESLSASFQLYSSVSKTYIEVGNVSLLGNFISKRLRACYSTEEKKLDFLSVITGTVVKIPVLIANMLELSETSIHVPEVLKKQMNYL